jgi:hypothetical protein
MTESVIGTGRIWTDKYKDTIHVIFQRLNLSFVVTLSFFPVKSPERVGTAVEIAYHAGFSTRVIGDRATFRVADARLMAFTFPLW